MEKGVEYFPHDCNANTDPKIMLLISQLGLEAYGIYWVLIEYLRQQTNYTAPMLLLDPLSRRYGQSKEKFEAVVTRFGLFDYNETTFTSPSLARRMEPLERKRERMKSLAVKRWESDACAMRTHSAGNAQAMQSKVEYSKVEESRVKESKEEKTIEEKKEDLLLRKRSFFSEVEKFTQYPGEMLQSFFDYWTELNKSGTRMRYELEKTFEIAKRLSYWASREKSFKKG